MVPFTTF